MVPPDDSETPPAAAEANGVAPAEAGMRLFGAMAIGLGTGAFVAALVRGHAVRLDAGMSMDSLAWRGSGWPWLLALLLGFVAGRLAATAAWRRGAALLLVALVLVTAGIQLSSLDLHCSLPCLHVATAAALGCGLGLQVPAMRRGSPWSSMALATFVGGGSAVAGIEYATAELCGAVAMGACLLAVASAPDATSRPRPWREWWSPLAVLAFAGAIAVLLAVQPAWLAAFVALSLVTAATGRCGAVIGGALGLALLSWGTAREPADDTRERVLARHAGTTVVYRRATQELRLLRDGRCVAAFGPDRSEATLATAMLHAFARDGDRVLLLGAGALRIAQSVPRAAPWVVERLVDDRDLGDLPARLMADGPVPPPALANFATDGTAAVGRCRSADWPSLSAGSRQLVLVAEDALGAGPHRAAPGCQGELRRIAGRGIVLQLLALDRAAPTELVALLDAALRAHPWNGLYLVGDGAVLVSAAAAPEVRAGFEDWSDDARWAMHAAHLGGPEDLQHAFAGVVVAPVDATSHHDDVARILLHRLEPAIAQSSADSLLLYWLRQQSDQRRARARLLTLPADAAGRAEAQALAAPFLPIGAPQPWLQAALALPDLDGGRLADPGRASGAAHSLDPTFFDAAPALFADLPRPRQARGALEDLWQLGSGARLAERCVGDGPMAAALRGRFASRCARALVEALADGPLTVDQDRALRELADPFVLEQAARRLLPLGRWQELLGWWRGDLPLPAALRDPAVLQTGRLRLAAALRGRREPSCVPLLAELLLDEDREVRQVAGEVLHDMFDGTIAFDADWPRSDRLDAAARLRELHNRRP